MGVVSSVVLTFYMCLIRTYAKDKKELREEILVLKSEKHDLDERNRRLRLELGTLKTHQKKSMCEKLLTDDAEVKYYTGLPTKKIFESFYKLICGLVDRHQKRMQPVSSKAGTRFRNATKPNYSITSKDEFLLAHMRIRLGDNRHSLARQFGISDGLFSTIFHSWLPAMAAVYGALVYIPDLAVIKLMSPKRFKKFLALNLRIIIDCTEFFIETPKDLKMQAATWSQYKHHNTGKLLIAVTPSGMIAYVSLLYGGRASDKALTLFDGLLDKLNPFEGVMADKGFQLEQDCAERSLHYFVPPGKRGVAQFHTSDVMKTCDIAKVRIIVEQMIRKLKCFNYLKREIPIHQIPYVDDVVRVAAGIVNLSPPMWK